MQAMHVSILLFVAPLGQRIGEGCHEGCSVDQDQGDPAYAKCGVQNVHKLITNMYRLSKSSDQV